MGQHYLLTNGADDTTGAQHDLHAPGFVGTSAQRTAYPTGALLTSDLWFESDTLASYQWNGTSWQVYGSAGTAYNYLINGGFNFVQRWSTSLSTNTQSTTGRIINADRWGLTAAVASGQYGRIDTATSPVTGITARYYGKFVQITAAGKQGISQVVEGADTMALRGQYVRFQAWIRMPTNTSATNIRMGVLYLTSSGTIDTMPSAFWTFSATASVDPTLGTNLTALTPTNPDGGAISGSYMTITPTSAFTRYSCVVQVPSNCLNIIPVIFTDSQMAVSDELDITQAGLYLGSSVFPWNPKSVEEELARCQRYYFKTFSRDTAPAQNVGAGTGEFKFIAGIAGASAERSPSFTYPVPMRTTPGTTTTYNPAASSSQVRDETASADCTSTAIVTGNERSVAFTCTGNASTVVGGLLGVHFTADAEI